RILTDTEFAVKAGVGGKSVPQLLLKVGAVLWMHTIEPIVFGAAVRFGPQTEQPECGSRTAEAARAGAVLKGATAPGPFVMQQGGAHPLVFAFEDGAAGKRQIQIGM